MESVSEKEDPASHCCLDKPKDEGGKDEESNNGRRAQQKDAMLKECHISQSIAGKTATSVPGEVKVNKKGLRTDNSIAMSTCEQMPSRLENSAASLKENNSDIFGNSNKNSSFSVKNLDTCDDAADVVNGYLSDSHVQLNTRLSSKIGVQADDLGIAEDSPLDSKLPREAVPRSLADNRTPEGDGEPSSSALNTSSYPRDETSPNNLGDSVDKACNKQEDGLSRSIAKNSDSPSKADNQPEVCVASDSTMKRRDDSHLSNRYNTGGLTDDKGSLDDAASMISNENSASHIGAKNSIKLDDKIPQEDGTAVMDTADNNTQNGDFNAQHLVTGDDTSEGENNKTGANYNTETIDKAGVKGRDLEKVVNNIQTIRESTEDSIHSEKDNSYLIVSRADLTKACAGSTDRCVPSKESDGHVVQSHAQIAGDTACVKAAYIAEQGENNQENCDISVRQSNQDIYATQDNPSEVIPSVDKGNTAQVGTGDIVWDCSDDTENTGRVDTDGKVAKDCGVTPGSDWQCTRETKENPSVPADVAGDKSPGNMMVVDDFNMNERDLKVSKTNNDELEPTSCSRTLRTCVTGKNIDGPLCDPENSDCERYNTVHVPSSDINDTESSNDCTSSPIARHEETCDVSERRDVTDTSQLSNVTKDDVIDHQELRVNQDLTACSSTINVSHGEVTLKSCDSDVSTCTQVPLSYISPGGTGKFDTEHSAKSSSSGTADADNIASSEPQQRNVVRDDVIDTHSDVVIGDGSSKDDEANVNKGDGHTSSRADKLSPNPPSAGDALLDGEVGKGESSSPSPCPDADNNVNHSTDVIDTQNESSGVPAITDHSSLSQCNADTQGDKPPAVADQSTRSPTQGVVNDADTQGDKHLSGGVPVGDDACTCEVRGCDEASSGRSAVQQSTDGQTSSLDTTPGLTSIVTNPDISLGCKDVLSTKKDPIGAIDTSHPRNDDVINDQKSVNTKTEDIGHALCTSSKTSDSDAARDVLNQEESKQEQSTNQNSSYMAEPRDNGNQAATSSVTAETGNVTLPELARNSDVINMPSDVTEGNSSNQENGQNVNTEDSHPTVIDSDTDADHLSDEQTNANQSQCSKVKDKILQAPGEVKDKILQGSGEVKDKILQGSGEVKDKILQGSGEVKDKILQGSGEVKDKILQAPGEVKDKILQGSGEVKDKILQGSGEVKDNSFRSEESVCSYNDDIDTRMSFSDVELSRTSHEEKLDICPTSPVVISCNDTDSNSNETLPTNESVVHCPPLRKSLGITRKTAPPLSEASRVSDDDIEFVKISPLRKGPEKSSSSPGPRCVKERRAKGVQAVGTSEGSRDREARTTGNPRKSKTGMKEGAGMKELVVKVWTERGARPGSRSKSPVKRPPPSRTDAPQPGPSRALTSRPGTSRTRSAPEPLDPEPGRRGSVSSDSDDGCEIVGVEHGAGRLFLRSHGRQTARKSTAGRKATKGARDSQAGHDNKDRGSNQSAVSRTVSGKKCWEDLAHNTSKDDGVPTTERSKSVDSDEKKAGKNPDGESCTPVMLLANIAPRSNSDTQAITPSTEPNTQHIKPSKGIDYRPAEQQDNLTGERQKCQQCESSFTDEENLKHHMQKCRQNYQTNVNEILSSSDPSDNQTDSCRKRKKTFRKRKKYSQNGNVKDTGCITDSSDDEDGIDKQSKSSMKSKKCKLLKEKSVPMKSDRRRSLRSADSSKRNNTSPKSSTSSETAQAKPDVIKLSSSSDGSTDESLPDICNTTHTKVTSDDEVSCVQLESSREDENSVYDTTDGGSDSSSTSSSDEGGTRSKFECKLCFRIFSTRENRAKHVLKCPFNPDRVRSDLDDSDASAENMTDDDVTTSTNRNACIGEWPAIYVDSDVIQVIDDDDDVSDRISVTSEESETKVTRRRSHRTREGRTSPGGASRPEVISRRRKSRSSVCQHRDGDYVMEVYTRCTVSIATPWRSRDTTLHTCCLCSESYRDPEHLRNHVMTSHPPEVIHRRKPPERNRKGCFPVRGQVDIPHDTPQGVHRTFGWERPPPSCGNRYIYVSARQEWGAPASPRKRPPATPGKRKRRASTTSTSSGEEDEVDEARLVDDNSDDDIEDGRTLSASSGDDRESSNDAESNHKSSHTARNAAKRRKTRDVASSASNTNHEKHECRYCHRIFMVKYNRDTHEKTCFYQPVIIPTVDGDNKPDVINNGDVTNLRNDVTNLENDDTNLENDVSERDKGSNDQTNDIKIITMNGDNDVMSDDDYVIILNDDSDDGEMSRPCKVENTTTSSGCTDLRQKNGRSRDVTNSDDDVSDEQAIPDSDNDVILLDDDSDSDKNDVSFTSSPEQCTGSKSSIHRDKYECKHCHKIFSVKATRDLHVQTCIHSPRNQNVNHNKATCKTKKNI